jgi:hypothetical protein
VIGLECSKEVKTSMSGEKSNMSVMVSSFLDVGELENLPPGDTRVGTALSLRHSMANSTRPLEVLPLRLIDTKRTC